MAFSYNDAVNAGVIEKILSTDVSDEWITELVEAEFGKNIDERDTSYVKLQILRTLHHKAFDLARLMENESTRDFWMKEVKKNSAKIDELREKRSEITLSLRGTVPAWYDDMDGYLGH